MSFLSKRMCPEINCALVIEDNNKVAYAYLLKDNKIVGDVWLYNRIESPVLPEWHDKNNMPFANSKDYAIDNVEPIERDEELSIKWNIESNMLRDVEIFYKNKKIAKLCIGSKPGWCVWAKKNGPLAKIL